MKTAYARFPAFDDLVAYICDGVEHTHLTLMVARQLIANSTPVNGESEADCDARLQRGEPVEIRVFGRVIALHLLPNAEG